LRDQKHASRELRLDGLALAVIVKGAALISEAKVREVLR
jgi:hypothetical protein